MTDTKSGYKRRFPRVGRCCCCCSPEISITVCTIILIVIFGFGSFFSGLLMSNIVILNLSVNSFSAIIGLVISVCILISLILLVIGVNKSKLSFMRQFKIVFLLYLIYQIISFVYTAIYIFSDDYIKDSLKTMKDTYKQLNMEGVLTDEQLTTTIKHSMMITIVEYIVILLLLIYYYLSTCSYIEDVEEREAEEKDIRNLENNEY